MISGYWGLSLNILSIIFVSLYLSLFFISATIFFISGMLNRFQAQAKLRILWCMGILPWLICLACTGILVIPELWGSGDTWVSALVHWHHIYYFSLFSWHGASLCVFSMIFFCVCVVKLAKAIKASTQLNQLNFFTKGTNFQGVTVIESEQYHAFTSGLFRPTAYITSGLRNQLTYEEASVVASHELAHVRTRDPLRKYLYSLFVAFFPKFISQKLNSGFSLALEQAADESVLTTINDDTLISKTLLKVARLGVQFSGSQIPSSNCNFINHPLNLRIQYLLSDSKGQPFPIISFGLFAIAATIASTLSVDLLHHTLEQLFIH